MEHLYQLKHAYSCSFITRGNCEAIFSNENQCNWWSILIFDIVWCKPQTEDKDGKFYLRFKNLMIEVSTCLI